MEKSLDFKITASSLLKFSLPVIFAVVFENIYSLVDSLFVANLVGTEALSAVNIVAPSLSVTLAIAVMIATGGCAIVSAQMGEENMKGARENFTFFVFFAFGISLALSIMGLICKRPLLYILGADDTLYSLCESYAVPIFIIIPFVTMIDLMYLTASIKGYVRELAENSDKAKENESDTVIAFSGDEKIVFHRKKPFFKLKKSDDSFRVQTPEEKYSVKRPLI